MSGQFHASVALTSGVDLLVPVEQEGGWAASSFWTFWWSQNMGTGSGFQSLQVRKQITISTELFQVLSELTLAFLMLEVRDIVAQ